MSGVDEAGIKAIKMLGIQYLGFVKDVESLMSRTTLLLVPGMVGSGTTTKVQLGIEYQVPVVTTSFGRRGVWHDSDPLPETCKDPHWPLVLRDDPKQYADAVLRLLADNGAYAGTVQCLTDFQTSMRQQRPAAQHAALTEMSQHCQALSVQRKRHVGTTHAEQQKRHAGANATIAHRAAGQRNTWVAPALLREAEAERPRKDQAFMRQMTKFTSWRGHSDSLASAYLRGRDLTVLTTFVSKDYEFVNSWLLDIARQRALGVYSIELVIGCFEPVAYELMVNAVGQKLSVLSELARVSVALFKDDPGIYGMWDAIVARPSCAPIVTNWNVDDRKRPDSLLIRLNKISMIPPTQLGDPYVHQNLPDAVTSDVLLYTEPPLGRPSMRPCIWSSNRHPGFSMGHGRLNDDADLPTTLGCYAWSTPKIYSMRLFDRIGRSQKFPSQRISTRLRLKDMLVLEKNKRWPGGHKVIGSHNVPHNSPMWRKSMHEQLGGFSPRDGTGCYDFSFWLKALTHNYTFWHLSDGLELYLVRA